MKSSSEVTLATRCVAGLFLFGILALALAENGAGRGQAPFAVGCVRPSGSSEQLQEPVKAERTLQPMLALVQKPAQTAQKPKVLLVCAEPAAMPRTGKSPEGMPQGVDLALAELLCKSLGRKLEVHWCASPACSRKCLREGRCDVILGHPHDPDGASIARVLTAECVSSYDPTS